MKTNDTHAFVNQLLLWLLVTICSSGSIGLGTVWMRNQISVTANTNRLLAEEIAKLDRMIEAKKTEVAAEQVRPILRQRNTEMRLGLDQVNDRQLIRVVDDPAQLLMARHTREVFRDSLVIPAIRIAALGQ